MEKTIKDLDIYISDGNYSSKYPRSEEFVDEGIPFIRGNNMVDGDITDDEMYHITPEKHAVLLKGHVKAGDVLITTRGNIGQVAIVPDRHEDSNINAQIVLLRTNPESLYNRYLLWALQSQRANEQYLALQTGTALKQLPVGKLEKLLIKVADINKQHEIADILDKTYGVIKARRNELQLLDDLIKARFVELFGDPIINSNSYNVLTLNDVCTKVTDGTHDTPERFEEGVLLLTGKNIRATGIIFDDIEYVSEKDHRIIYDRCNPEYGDVLYTNIGVNYGTACFNNLDYEFSMKNIALLKPQRDILNGYYLWICLNYMRDYILAQNQVGGAQTFMGLATIKKITIPVPPIEIQIQFEKFIKQVDKSKVVVQKALDKAQLLFDSLMQEYFG